MSSKVKLARLKSTAMTGTIFRLCFMYRSVKEHSDLIPKSLMNNLALGLPFLSDRMMVYVDLDAYLIMPMTEMRAWQTKVSIYCVPIFVFLKVVSCTYSTNILSTSV